jgi:hypothetical protein
VQYEERGEILKACVGSLTCLEPGTMSIYVMHVMYECISFIIVEVPHCILVQSELFIISHFVHSIATCIYMYVCVSLVLLCHSSLVHLVCM